jgi:hypothetical protein
VIDQREVRFRDHLDHAGGRAPFPPPRP